MDLKNIMLEPEYDFLRDHERLRKRIILMGLGGNEDKEIIIRTALNCIC